MVDIRRVIDKIKNGMTPDYEELDPIEADARDRVTTDKYLRSLRRQYRVEQERNEKDALKVELARIEKEKERKYLWGFTEGSQYSKPPKRKQSRKRKTTYLSKTSLR